MFDIIRVNDKLIARIRIDEGLEKPYHTSSGKYMVRVGSSKRNSSREELLRLFQNARVYHIDGNPVPGSAIEDLDTILINASIAAPLHSKLCPSFTGLLFFGLKNNFYNALEKHLPHAGIQFVAYEDDDDPENRIKRTP